MSVAARRYYLRGREAQGRGDLDGAVTAFSSAVELAPSFAAARVALASALARHGDCPRAAAVCRAGLGHPVPPASRALLWATLGDVLVQGGDFPGAESAYTQCDGDPAFAARAAAGRARIAARQGHYREAFSHLARAAASR